MRPAQPWSMRSRVRAGLGILARGLVLLATPARASAGTTERVSVDSAGNEGNGYSLNAALDDITYTTAP
jgi:hypothetical protein